MGIGRVVARPPRGPLGRGRGLPVDGIELRAGDRVRWTRNDTFLGLVNSFT